MVRRSLQVLLDEIGDPVGMLRNAPVAPYTYPLTYPIVPAEYSNWRDEQASWRQSCAFFDLSHHMTDVIVRGPDATALLEGLAVNTFSNFQVDRAKQLVACSPEGHVIGDGILFHLDDDVFEFVGRSTVANWIEYNASSGDWDVTVDRDNASPPSLTDGPATRRFYRYQMQGPNAEPLIEKLHGGPYDDIKFFRMGYIEIDGTRVRALRHGMSGQPGLEIFGPYADGTRIKEAVLAAGEEFGITPIGATAYPTDTLESGWIPAPLSAVYTSRELVEYRGWLPADGPEGTGGSLSGSFVSDDVEDYYLTPYELGYGSFVKFDHDFVGGQALEAMDKATQRRKVTLEWNVDDVLAIHASLFDRRDLPYKYLRLPLTNYAGSNYDVVRSDDRPAGFSMYTGYSFNERRVVSLSVVDASLEVGDEVTVVWGEPEGGTAKPTVEPHRQIEVRATVCPVPYADFAREHYAEGWRTGD